MADNIVYTNEVALFTLKGPIAVQYLDGEIVEGEFVAQDAYNVFLNVRGESVMIPRLQIRMIKGLRGQQLEIDKAQMVLPEKPQLQSGSQADMLEARPRNVACTQSFPAPLNQSEEETLVASPLTQLPAVSVEGKDDKGDLIIALDDAKKKDEKPTIKLPKELSATLTCTSGPHIGEIYLLREGVTTIGRGSDNAIVLSDDNEISHQHAIVIKESGKYIVQDQNSLNGTFVNDVQVTGPYHLESGDEILVGVSILRYEWVRSCNDAVTTRVLKSFK
jgi:hypothetical protein